MKEKRMSISINLIVKDSEALMKNIANHYGCDVKDVDRNLISEYIENHIKAENTCDDLFVIEGAETDGWLVQALDCDNILK